MGARWAGIAALGLLACGSGVDSGGRADARPVHVGWWDRARLDGAALCGAQPPWTVEGDIFALPAPRPLPEGVPEDAIRDPTPAQAEAMELLLGTTEDGHFRPEDVERMVRALALVRAADDRLAAARRGGLRRRPRISLGFRSDWTGGPAEDPPPGLHGGIPVDPVHSGHPGLDDLNRRFGATSMRYTGRQVVKLEFGLPLDTHVVSWAYAALPGAEWASPGGRIGGAPVEAVLKGHRVLVTVNDTSQDPLFSSADPEAWYTVDTETWAVTRLSYAPGREPGHGAVLPFARLPQPTAQPYADLDALLAHTASPVWWEALHAVATVGALGCGPVEALSQQDREQDGETDRNSEHFSTLRDALLADRAAAAQALVRALDHADPDVRAAALERLHWWSDTAWGAADQERWAAWARGAAG